MFFSGEMMPQTVPSAGFSPQPDYSAVTDNFDLSLLPDFEDVPSPTSFFQNQQMSFYDAAHSPIELKVYSTSMANGGQIFATVSPSPQSTHELFENCIKQEHQYDNSCIKQEVYESRINLQDLLQNPQFLQDTGALSPASISSPLSPAVNSSISTSSVASPLAVSRTVLSPAVSPMPALSPSPMPLSASPAPLAVHASELKKTVRDQCCVTTTSSPTNTTTQQPQPPAEDHQLLREVLRDTSFQKKFNLKPISIGNTTGFAVVKEQKAEENSPPELLGDVLALALDQLHREITNTCSHLGISSDPSSWSCEDVRAWLLWTCRQLSLPPISLEYFTMDGSALVALSAEEFGQRAPQGGEDLHAKLEMWKIECLDMDTSSAPSPHTSNTMSWGSDSGSPSAADISDDEEDDSADKTAPTTGSTPRGGSHIHLWQFLKELLSQPQVHGASIRWLDRSRGVFKIEDSVRVARLWGRRKNRPAMNYDKLSRSIRQYYKKGIMKKTERSQRLVYQFCHPYCL